ncbi:hypothetical protein [Sphingomonas sp.]|uniref:hypothetical protein n=1 Tax=Sphingomonas sp. TaxID=28214 RepID=UPI002634ED05|nr:hypothetical protein [Sphingomonas sp.]MDF2496089.1 hypothetical protein [Sphingomonas sp.]
MNDRVLLYGATGFSGQLLAAALADLGERLVLSGRSTAELWLLAERLGVEARVLGGEGDLAGGLHDIGLVVNAAGPFVRTAAAAMHGCLEHGCDYMDIAGEWPVFADALDRDAFAVSRGTMLLPGIGFAIAATDGALSMLAAAAEGAVRLRLAMSQPHALSAGSLATLWTMNDPAVRVRHNGALERYGAGTLWRAFDFGQGPVRAVAVSWPDVVTVERSTGIDSLEVYSAVGLVGDLAIRTGAMVAPLLREIVPVGGALPCRQATDEGPHARPAGRDMILVAEAEDRWRRVQRLTLRTPDGYATTTITAAAAVRRWLRGERRAGFQTPSGLFGPDFIHSCGAVARIT